MPFLFDIISDTANVITGNTPNTPTPNTPSPTPRTPSPTPRTPTPTTRTPAPTIRTPTPTTRTPTPTTRTPTTTAPVPTTETPTVTDTEAPTVTVTEPPAPASTTAPPASIVAAAETSVTSTPAPIPTSSSVTEATVSPAPASASASATASATVVIQDDSQSKENDVSSLATSAPDLTSSEGMSTTSVIFIVATAVFAVLVLSALAFWIYRRRRQKMTPRSPSFDASYAVAPISLPTVNAIALDSWAPASQITIHNVNNFNRTVDLDSSVKLDTTFRLGASSISVESKKSSTSLWEDEVITAARIPMEKLIRNELISQGGHGAVYQGLYRGESVAMKVLLPEKRKDMRQINIFLAEIKLMATVEHPRIVRFVGVAWDALSDLCAVSEFMEGGDLFSLLRHFDRVEHRAQGCDGEKAKIAVHVAQALTYLHSLEPLVLHRDLKSMNILISADGDAKLTDFGVSRMWTVDTMTAGVGTRRWMAPEVMMGKRYDASADIFSFGVVLSELDTHQPPYMSAITTLSSESGDKISETALMEMVAMGRVRVEFSANAPTALVNLGYACVDLNPSARPTAGEVHYQLQKILRKYQKYTL